MTFDDDIPEEHKAKYAQKRERCGEYVQATLRIIFDYWKQIRHQTKTLDHYELIVPIQLIRHIMEMLDGISVLVGKGCAEPAKTSLRSLFEAVVSLKYILKADTRDRSIAYQVGWWMKQHSTNERYDPSTKKGKIFETEMANDSEWQSIKPDPTHMKVMKNRILYWYDKPELAGIRAEFDAEIVKRKAAKAWKLVPDWYNLRQGPANIKMMCEGLDMRSHYETLYKTWSDTIHAGNGMSHQKYLLDGNSMHGHIVPLRFPDDLKIVSMLSVNLSIMAMNSLFDKYAPVLIGTFGTRYINEVYVVYPEIRSNDKLINTDWDKMISFS